MHSSSTWGSNQIRWKDSKCLLRRRIRVRSEHAGSLGASGTEADSLQQWFLDWGGFGCWSTKLPPWNAEVFCWKTIMKIFIVPVGQSSTQNQFPPLTCHCPWLVWTFPHNKTSWLSQKKYRWNLKRWRNLSQAQKEEELIPEFWNSSANFDFRFQLFKLSSLRLLQAISQALFGIVLDKYRQGKKTAMLPFFSWRCCTVLLWLIERKWMTYPIWYLYADMVNTWSLQLKMVVKGWLTQQGWFPYQSWNCET